MTKPRILLVGMCNPDQSVGAVLRAAGRAGVPIEHYPLKSRCWDVGKDRAGTEILEAVGTGRFDLVLFYNSEAKELRPGLVGAIRGSGVPVFYFSFDDPQRALALVGGEAFLEADAVLTCDALAPAVYRRHGARLVVFHPPAIDPELHRWAPGPEAPAPAAFVLTAVYRRGKGPTVVRTDRAELLDGLRQAFGAGLLLRGPEQHLRRWGSSGFLQWEDWSAFVPTAVCHLNPTADVRGAFYLNERVGQILGCAGFMLADRANRLDELLEGKAVFFDSIPEALDLVRFYAAHPEEASRIGAAGRAWALRWTYDDWIARVVALFAGEEPSSVLDVPPFGL